MITLLLLIFALIFVVQGFGSCHKHTTCSSCVSSPSSSLLGATCRWCAKSPDADGHFCHEAGSSQNPCHHYENIKEEKVCDCVPAHCKPPPGNPGTSKCAWYNAGSIDHPPRDPKDWLGADFLPESYRHAAECACNGGGNPLWELPAARCVRKKVLDAHRHIDAHTRREIRAATLSWNPITTYKFLPMIYEMHVKAYADCCCSGKVAPKEMWYAVFFLGKLVPCYNDNSIGGDIVSFILQFGRCGCGW